MVKGMPIFFKKTAELLERISEASDNSKSFDESPHILAGREAEYLVNKEINSKIKDTGWSVYSSVRVPTLEKYFTRREYDFIITTTEEVYVIELKNWSGNLELIDKEFIQHRRYNNEEVVNHGDLLEELETKTDLLKKYYVREAKGEISISPLLVFYNSNLNISDDIKSDRRVATYDELKELLPISDSVNVNLLEAILIYLGLKKEEKKDTAKNSISRPIKIFKNILEKLGTWDVLEYNGKKISFGDILGKRSGELVLGNINITDRKTISSINVKVDRGFFKALIKDPQYILVINYRDDTIAEINFPKKSTIKFQSAGSDQQSEVLIRNLTNIEYGYTTKAYSRINYSDLKKGMAFEGKITSVVDFGVFVDIGLEANALLHVSQIKNISKYEEGEKIFVEILKLDHEKERVSLKLLNNS